MSESGSIEGDGIGQAAAQRSSRNRFAVAGDIWFGGVVGVGCIVASALTSSIADRKIVNTGLVVFAEQDRFFDLDAQLVKS